MKVAYPLKSEPVRVVVVRLESTVVEGEREKIPFVCFSLIDCKGMMEWGNEVGSGYANACLLLEVEMGLSVRARGSYAAMPRCHLSNGP